MRGLDKRFTKKYSEKKGRPRKLGLRDRLLNQINRLSKEQSYKVKKSNEPDEKGDYIVYYESISNHGYGWGKVFKGSYRECQEMAKELNEIIKERRKLK